MRRVRLRALLALAVLSGLAVAVVLHFGTERSSAQREALAALRTAPGTLGELQSIATARRQAAANAKAGQTVTVVEAPTPSPTPTPSPVTHTTAAAPVTTATATHTTATTTTTAAATTTIPTDVGLPKVGHVFVIELSDTGESQAFGSNSAAPYLRSLVAQGTLLANYRSLGHGELADELATTLGQPPNADTSAGCTTYSAFKSGVQPDGAGVVPGAGCLYPDSVASLADNVATSGRRWSAFIPGLDQSACATPQVGTGLNSPIQGVSAAYDPVHNPFIFAQSLVEAGGCASSDVDVTHLATELNSAGLTPTYSYLAPDACGDGARAPVSAPATTPTTTTTGAATTSTAGTSTAGTTSGTGTGTGTTAATTTTSTVLTTPTAAPGATRTGVCGAGVAAGMPAEDAFLSEWVPRILASPAYRADGVLIIAFNGIRPAHGDSPFSTGALVLSHWTRANRVLKSRYAPYSLLHSVEDMLDLQPLGKAAGAAAFAKAVL